MRVEQRLEDQGAGRDYCRVAFLDRSGRFLAGEQDAAERYRRLDGPGPGYDIRTSLLVLDIQGARRGEFGAPEAAALLVAFFDPQVLAAKMGEVAAFYGLTARQADFLESLIQLGGVRDAAAARGLGYTAARNLLADIKAKTGFATLAALVGHVLQMVSGTPAAANDPVDRHDLFGLSDRQFAIATALSTSPDRRALAGRLGVSEAVLKAELKDIFLILGVENAGQLARAAIEARLSIARLRPAGEAAPAHGLPESLLAAEGGRTIAYSDFGPASGRPVFILHSTITARAPPTRLVAALRAAGFRPLAIDRPGFGATSAAAEGADNNVVAANDFRRVCAALDIARADIVARGSAHAAVVLAREAGGLLGRVVLVNPTPRIDFTTTDRGPLGAVKRRYFKSPAMIAAMIRLLAAFATPRRMREGMLRSFRGSPPDEALIDDPVFVADYLRATRGFAEGHISGYVSEQSAWSRGYDVAPMPGMRGWRIVQGEHFVLHDPAEALAYWRIVLPDTPISVVPEAGQMLAYSHPDHVVSALVDR